MASRPPRIVPGVIIKALEFQINALKQTKPDDPEFGNNIWKVMVLQEQIEAMQYRPTRESTAGWGGEWLGIIREWIKCKFRNGCDVTWGSHEALTGGPVITPALLEGLAANIASAAIREHMGPVYQPKPPQQN